MEVNVFNAHNLNALNVVMAYMQQKLAVLVIALLAHSEIL